MCNEKETDRMDYISLRNNMAVNGQSRDPAFFRIYPGSMYIIHMHERFSNIFLIWNSQ